MNIKHQALIPPGFAITICKPSRRKASARFDSKFANRRAIYVAFPTPKAPDEMKPIVKIYSAR